MALSFFLISLAFSVTPWPVIKGNRTGHQNFPAPPFYERLRSALHAEIEAGQHMQKREAPDENSPRSPKNPDNFPSPLFYEAVWKTLNDVDNDNVSTNEAIARRMFTEDLRSDNYEDPHDGPSNSWRGFLEASTAAFLWPWRFTSNNFPLEPQDITDFDIKPVRRTRRFVPGLPNPFIGLQRLFEPGKDTWDPNIPYVIYSSPSTRPGFRPNGAVSGYTGPDRNAIYYPQNSLYSPQNSLYSPQNSLYSSSSSYSHSQALVTQPGVAKKKK